MTTRVKRTIPVRNVSSETTLAELNERLREYEQRYEMSTEKMATLLALDAIRPTAEVLRWYSAYQGTVLIRRATPTTGTPGTTTAPSTKPD